ncbi:phospholipid-transporting ATPase IK-like [Pseudophryne corroboree]|uniref:phospholipid-transporting ATPase IK-like n=1 Tax=Pseudophryne corroboree TaxID=495146 RepID=UPI0030821B8F
MDATIRSPDAGNDVDYSWEVKANDRSFYEKFKKKGFLCFHRNKYADNTIKTSKYNLLTFIPKNLYEQYHQLHVIYFTAIFIIQSIPQIKTQPTFIYAIVLLSILIARSLRDLLDDIKRHRNDNLINNQSCEIFRGQSLQNLKWKDIQVGDIVCLRKDSFVPADMLLLYSTEPNSLCYVETTGIDGETNLKYRQSLVDTHCALHTEQALAEFDGLITCELPNARLHNFVGILDWKGKKYPLSNDNILLRDCRIRNTATCYGLVIYAGVDTKIMKNAGKVTMKRTNLDNILNKCVLIIVLILVSVSFGLAVGAGVWNTLIMGKVYYIPGSGQLQSPTVGFYMFWGYFTTMSTLVPFVLYISLDSIHVIHNVFISQDLEMYHSESDSPAQARGNSLCDMLAQIDYIFTDKTGTLTQNVMMFKKCCIGQRVFGTTTGKEEEHKEVSFAWNQYADKAFQYYDQSLTEELCKNEDPLSREFFRAIALCHTVMLDNTNEGALIYKSASPDEQALVTAARNFGYVFLSRTQQSITISELGTEKTYNILSLMDFNSVRKRMSILVRDEEGKIKLYTKGADSVILRRLHPSCETDFLMNALDEFTEETLRTLCLAYKELEEHDYKAWELTYNEASLTLRNRADHLDKVYEAMETDLQLLGATAIEDKLQNGVSETIQLLKDGNIKIWMLTGDKPETAVNIAYSCKLLSSDMEIVEESELRCLLESGIDCKNQSGERNSKICGDLSNNKALVITGDFLDTFMNFSDKKALKMSKWKHLEGFLKRKKITDLHTHLRTQAFVELACQYQTVICSRVTPKQKASIVGLVKTNQKVTTLAIGDGGNDVNMLKTAHIGVGIMGKEGVQAVLASDFALAQFSYLQNLLFFHGRLSYIRFSKFLSFYNFKTFASLLHNAWFAFFNGFSALLVSDIMFLVFNAFAYTLLPSLYMGIMDKDVDSKTSRQHPELYITVQKDKNLLLRIIIHIIYGIYTSLIMFFIPYFAFYDSAGPGGIFDYHVLVFTMNNIYVLSVLAEAVLVISSWTVAAFLAIVISLINYFFISFLTTTASAYFSNMTYFKYLGAMLNSINNGYLCLILLLAVTLSIIPSLFCRLWCKLSVPTLMQSIPSRKKTVELHSAFRRDSSKRSSYAFSHTEGYGRIITKGGFLQKTHIQQKDQEKSCMNNGK